MRQEETGMATMAIQILKGHDEPMSAKKFSELSGLSHKRAVSLLSKLNAYGKINRVSEYRIERFPALYAAIDRDIQERAGEQ